MATVRVVLADDNVIVRAGIEALLSVEDDIDVVGMCGSLPELLDAVDEHRPDVVLTDIAMPPTSTDEGIRAASLLRRSHPGLGVVVLSQYLEADFALALVRDGSQRRAYLLKERVGHASQLAEAIRAVATGGSRIDPLVVDALVATQQRRADGPLDRLTPREREVLGEIAAGRSNAAVAERLAVTERAVEKHVNSIFSKLGLTDDGDVHRRVTAVLLHLADTRPGTTRP